MRKFYEVGQLTGLSFVVVVATLTKRLRETRSQAKVRASKTALVFLSGFANVECMIRISYQDALVRAVRNGFPI